MTTDDTTEAPDNAAPTDLSGVPSPDPDSPLEFPTEVDGDSEPVSKNREAAKYRKQLRETESERDALRERLTAARSEVLVNTKHAQALDPAARSAAFSDPDRFFDDAGQVEVQAVEAHLAQLRAESPFMFSRTVIPGQGKYPSELAVRGTSWETAFSPK